jgi:uroporphyrinogen-III synthase
MQNKRIQILSTKALDEALLTEAANHEIDIDCLPFIETIPVVNNDITDAVNLLKDKSITAIFTSSRSVTAVAELLDRDVNWNIYCLFGATKEQVQIHFPQSAVHATAADSASLAAEIIETGIKEVYFFCGDKRMDTMPEKLAGKANLKELVVYTTHEVTHTLEQSFDGLLFFSPSAVKSFCSTNHIDAATICFAVGNTTARSLQPFTKNIITAATASAEAMINKVKEAFNKI